MKNPKTKGFIYFLRAKGYSGGMKIGFSSDPKARMKQLRSEVGVPLRLQGYVPGTQRHEQVIHAILSHARLHGEWFYTRDIRISAFIGKIIRENKFPADFFDDIPWRHHRLGGTKKVCNCGRVLGAA